MTGPYEDWDALLDEPCGPSDADRALMELHDELAAILGDYDAVEDRLEVA